MRKNNKLRINYIVVIAVNIDHTAKYYHCLALQNHTRKKILLKE